ncbi:hypothetical protein M8J76_015935 [Diaphorina citri]|nr:hypothetical protein M8J76_015935 [Diaphorina citri]
MGDVFCGGDKSVEHNIQAVQSVHNIQAVHSVQTTSLDLDNTHSVHSDGDGSMESYPCPDPSGRYDKESGPCGNDSPFPSPMSDNLAFHRNSPAICAKITPQMNKITPLSPPTSNKTPTISGKTPQSNTTVLCTANTTAFINTNVPSANATNKTEFPVTRQGKSGARPNNPWLEEYIAKFQGFKQEPLADSGPINTEDFGETAELKLSRQTDSLNEKRDASPNKSKDKMGLQDEDISNNNTFGYGDLDVKVTEKPFDNSSSHKNSSKTSPFLDNPSSTIPNSSKSSVPDIPSSLPNETPRTPFLDSICAFESLLTHFSRPREYEKAHIASATDSENGKRDARFGQLGGPFTKTGNSPKAMPSGRGISASRRSGLEVGKGAGLKPVPGGLKPASGGLGSYKCDKCGNAYARLHSLSRHIKFECGVAPKFECFICHKRSKHKHNLLLHMKTHTKLRTTRRISDSGHQQFSQIIT